MIRPTVFISTILLCNCGHAGLVSTASTGSADAIIISSSDTADSMNSSDVIQAFASENNSTTETNLSWSFNGLDAISFVGSIEHDKSVSARPGGDHTGTINYQFDFTIDSFTDYALNGTYGFDQGLDATSGVDDLFAYSLSGTTSSGSFTSGPTAAFSGSGNLAPGTYSLIVNMAINETIKNAGNRAGGFEGVLSLTDSIAPVPEPRAMSLIVIAMLAVTPRRRQRRPVKQHQIAR